MKLFNNTNEDLRGWKVSIKAPQDAMLGEYSETECEKINNGLIVFKNTSYNEVVAVNSNVIFKFHISTIEHYFLPSDIIINGTENVTTDESPSQVGKRKIEVVFDKDGSWGSEGDCTSQYTVTILNIGDINVNTWSFEVIFNNDVKFEAI